MSNMNSKTITISKGVEMPLIGFGTFQTANLDPERFESSLEEALKCGYRHIDTAYLYQNEDIVGKVVNRWISNGLVKREDLFITTKLPLTGVHPDRVEFFLNKSLKNLGLKYVDLYLVHYPICLKFDEVNNFPSDESGRLFTEPTDHVAVWKKMEEQVDSGKARSIGLSNFNQSQITKILNIARIKPANLQIEIHVYFQNHEIVDFCKKNGISVVAFSPLGCPAFNEFNKRVGLPTSETPNLMEDPVVVAIAKKHSKTPAQVLLRYLIERGLATIPKSLNHARIKENIDIFDFRLDNDDMSKLTSLNRGGTSKVVDLTKFKGLTDHPEYPYKEYLI
ncbi:hypothetical protein WA026_005858 [Henosepilachna vigintioctopunctata]|uniref:NADP-dependent oxidoreductase domain-containing protein n=1 Tax=Henosepilachna vigintioctopunctata TaxID=420089 RepID=A0AAW1U321_9CUCU